MPIQSMRLSGGVVKRRDRRREREAEEREMEREEAEEFAELAAEEGNRRALARTGRQDRGALKAREGYVSDYKMTLYGAYDIFENTIKWLGSLQEVIDRINARKEGVRDIYEDWMAEKAFSILADPTIVAPMAFVAASLGVSRGSVLKWKNDDTKPAFVSAIAYGCALQEMQLATMLRGGFKYSNNIAFILKNLHDWKDRTEDVITLDVSKLIKEIEHGAPRVDWDKASAIDADIVEHTANAQPIPSADLGADAAHT